MLGSAGTHLIIDAFVEDPQRFEQESLEQLFRVMAEALDLMIVREPELLGAAVEFQGPEQTENDAQIVVENIAATCVFSIGHMAIHCWPPESFFSADLFSCHEFDARVAIDTIRQYMGTMRENVHVLRRRKPLT